MKKSIVFILVLVMAMAVFTACAPTANAPASSTQSAAAPTQNEANTSDDDKASAGDTDPIRIGMITPVTGDRAETGANIQYSAQMVIDKVNAEGGILGRQVELIVEDSKGDSKEAVELAKKLIDDETICAVLGPATSAEAIACAPIFDENGCVELSPSASNSAYAPMSPYSFSIPGRQSVEMPFFIKNVISDYLGAKSVAVIHPNDDWGVDSLANIKEQCEKYNLPVTAESYNNGEKDFSAALTKLRQANPDVLILCTQPAEGSLILKQLKTIDWDVQTTGVGGMYSEQVITLAGEAANGLVGVSLFYYDMENATIADYYNEFLDRAGFAPTLNGPLGYDATLILCEAIRIAGTTDRDAIRDALMEVDGLTGVAGTYKFTEDGDVIRAYRIVGIENGKWVALSDYENYVE